MEKGTVGEVIAAVEFLKGKFKDDLETLYALPVTIGVTFHSAPFVGVNVLHSLDADGIYTYTPLCHVEKVKA